MRLAESTVWRRLRTIRFLRNFFVAGLFSLRIFARMICWERKSPKKYEYPFFLYFVLMPDLGFEPRFYVYYANTLPTRSFSFKCSTAKFGIRRSGRFTKSQLGWAFLACGEIVQLVVCCHIKRLPAIQAPIQISRTKCQSSGKYFSNLSFLVDGLLQVLSLMDKINTHNVVGVQSKVVLLNNGVFFSAKKCAFYLKKFNFAFVSKKWFAL